MFKLYMVTAVIYPFARCPSGIYILKFLDNYLHEGVGNIRHDCPFHLGYPPDHVHSLLECSVCAQISIDLPPTSSLPFNSFSHTVQVFTWTSQLNCK